MPVLRAKYHYIAASTFQSNFIKAVFQVKETCQGILIKIECRRFIRNSTSNKAYFATNSV